jgi:uncharacterized repeat protein (TIGR01451 family)
MPEDKIFDQQSLSQLPPTINNPQPKRGFWQFIKDNKIIFSGVFAGILVLLIFWFFLSGSSSNPAPTSENVVLLIKGPEKLTSGNEGEYRIIYRNGEDADLIGITLEMVYPSNFKYKSASEAPVSSTGQRFNLPVLKKGDDAEVVIRGQVSGTTGEIKEIKAKLSYKLSNFNSEFSVEERFRTEILAPNLTLDITGPIEVTAGQDTTFTVNYANVSGNEYDNVAIKLTYPTEYKFTSSVPAPSKDQSQWNIGKLALDGSGKVEITGSFIGSGREDLVIAEIGQIVGGAFAPLVNTSATFKVIKSPLSVQQTAAPNNWVNLGQTINFDLKYANDGEIGMTNVVVVATLEGATLDLSRISASNAVITGNTITWKAATLANLSVLSPREKGEMSFSVPVKNTLSAGAKNQVIKSSVIIYSAEMPKPVRAADIELKLASSLTLAITGDYISGSMPMKVGSPTVFAITMMLSNLSNDLENTEVIASIPLPASAWKNVIVPEAEKNRLSYDPNSGKVRWKIGNLPAFTGKFTPVLRATFQLEVTPTENDKGKNMDLLKNITASGKDTFINEIVEAPRVNDIKVGDLGDDRIDSAGSTVQ